MKPTLSKTQARACIETFFQQTSWTSGEIRKIRRLAMKYRLKLGAYKKSFCKRCLLPLRGKIRVTRTHTSVVCEKCGVMNRRAIRVSPMKLRL